MQQSRRVAYGTRLFALQGKYLTALSVLWYNIKKYDGANY